MKIYLVFGLKIEGISSEQKINTYVDIVESKSCDSKTTFSNQFQ